MAQSVKFRLDLFFDLLKVAPCVSSPKEVLDQIGEILNQVEDEHYGTAKDLDPMCTLTRDGRLYPPKECSYQYDSNKNIKRAETLNHWIRLRPDGSFKIFHKNPRKILIKKEGKNDS